MKPTCKKCGAVINIPKTKKIYQINDEKWNMFEIITCINFLLKHSPKKIYDKK